MKTIEYRRDEDKAKYQPGPWMDEPDKVQWKDEATGLPCLIVRNRLGALCGYVGVPRGHRFYGKDYDDVDVQVHGGLTFDGHCQEGGEPSETICHLVEEGESDDVWWLGFDCAHWQDYVPGMDTDEMRGYGLGSMNPLLESEFPTSYKDIEYVRAEIRELAGQLA